MADGDEEKETKNIDNPRRRQPDNRKVCGIVMPISSIGDEYSEEHWRRVRKIIQRAIERAQMRPQLVWENPEVDVIQSAILQNLYENDVVVCDLSGLNSNVMLETGLRLSTKRPTIIITDRVHRPPFDIATIGYIEYQRDLEYNSIEDFIEKLRKKIEDINRASAEGTYKSFVEQFRFETVTPTKISVSSDEYMREQIAELTSIVSRIERSQSTNEPQLINRSSARRKPHSSKIIGMFSYKMSQKDADRVESQLDALEVGVYSTVRDNGQGGFDFTIYKISEANINDKDVLDNAMNIIEKNSTYFD